MTARPRVSVVLPVRNGAAYLEESLESVLAQTLTDFEILAVNDNSEDATPSILARYARRDARVRVLQTPEPGLVPALNHGCAAARAPIIARMDADDVSESERLERQADALDGDSELVLVGSAVTVVNDEGQFLQTTRYPTTADELRRRLELENPIGHSAATFRRAAFERCGGYRPAFLHAEDYDLWLRLAEHGTLVNLAQPLLRYRLHAQQVTVVNLRQQVNSMLVARRLAAIRASGVAEPQLPDRVDAQFASELGIDQDDADLELARAAATWADFLAAIGLPELAASTVGVARAETASRHAQALLDRRGARAALASGSWLRALRLLLRAAGDDPVALARAAARSCRLPSGGYVSRS